jgi:hypothetical protein
LKNFFAKCFTLALGKKVFAEFFLTLGKVTSLPSVFLFDTRQSLLCRVQRLCRVFFIWLSTKKAKPPALGKEADSGSGS